MKKKIVLIMFVFGLWVQVAYTQDYTFRVLASKGQSKIKTAGSKWTILKTGERLNKGDRLKLSANSYLGLVHASGKTLELKKVGSYNITELSEELGANSKSIVSKYADFVISKMAPEAIEGNRKKYASVTGSGERGLYDTDIHLYVPKTVILLNNNAIVSWEHDAEDEVFVIIIKNIFGEILLTTESASPSYVINYSDDKIKNGCINNIIIIEVKLKNDETVTSQEIAIRLLDESDRKELKSSLSELESNLGKSSSLNNLILAGFYEENGLTLDAITSYENALILSPGIEYFQEVYDEFLIRNELKKPELIDNEK